MVATKDRLLVRNKLFAGRRGLNRQPLSENTSSQPLISGKKEGLEVAAIALFESSYVVPRASAPISISNQLQPYTTGAILL